MRGLETQVLRGRTELAAQLGTGDLLTLNSSEATP